MANDIVWDDEKPNTSGIVWDDEKPKRQPTSLATRIIEGINDPIIGAAQIADKVLVNPIRQLVSPGASSMEDVVRAREAAYQAPEGVDVARMVGNVASPMNYIGAGAALPRALAARPMAAAAAAGAGQGAMAPVENTDQFWQEKAGQAALGGAFGTGVHALARTVGGVVRPTPEARTLMDSGVALTPGQAAGTGTFINKAEQWMASNPVASHFVTGAQRRAVEEANRAAAQSVARMVDDKAKLGLPPREAIEQTREAISKAYDQSLEGMSWSANALANDLQASMQHLPTDLPLTPEKTVKDIGNYLNRRLGPWVKQGIDLTGDQLKQVDAELGQMARNLANSPNTTDKVQAPAWREVQSYVRNAMENAAATPEQYGLLSRANAAYRQLLALEKAMLPGHETFSPRRLKMTLDRMGIKGTELNQVANAMDATLPNTVPNSGTAERVIANALPGLLMGGGAGASGLGWDTVGAGMMAAGALGSRPGARFMTGGYGVQPYAEAAIRSLRRTIPAATRQNNPEE